MTAGVGQLTTFNQLGFKGKLDKPDGWYLPANKSDTAVVLETKASKIALGATQAKELLKNIRIMNAKYEHVVGILYNGESTRVFKNGEEYKEKGSEKLHNIAYYTALFNVDHIDQAAHLRTDCPYQQLSAFRVRHQEPLPQDDFHRLRIGSETIRRDNGQRHGLLRIPQCYS